MTGAGIRRGAGLQLGRIARGARVTGIGIGAFANDAVLVGPPREKNSMRPFDVIRQDDASGVSGTGKVIEGVVFSDGTCVTRWVAQASHGRSTVVWDGFGSFMSVHITPHPDNKSIIRFYDGEEWLGTEQVKKARPPKKARASAEGK